jgi:hypothetical protein
MGLGKVGVGGRVGLIGLILVPGARSCCLANPDFVFDDLKAIIYPHNLSAIVKNENV